MRRSRLTFSLFLKTHSNRAAVFGKAICLWLLNNRSRGLKITASISHLYRILNTVKTDQTLIDTRFQQQKMAL